MLFIDITSQLFRKNYFCCNFLKLNLYYDWTKNRRYSVILFKSGIKRIYSEGRMSKYQSIVSRMNHSAQNRRILFVFSHNFDIIHHRLSNIIVQLGKVVPNCTRYTSSQKIRTKSDGSSWKQEKLNVANVNKEKHGGNYEIGIWQLADKERECVGEFILSPHVVGMFQIWLGLHWLTTDVVPLVARIAYYTSFLPCYWLVTCATWIHGFICVWASWTRMRIYIIWYED
jgi:hypothetical protein